MINPLLASINSLLLKAAIRGAQARAERHPITANPYNNHNWANRIVVRAAQQGKE